MKKLLAPFRYFLLGCYTILTSKISVIILVICLALAILQVSTGYREKLIEKEQEMLYEKESPNVNYYYEEVDLVNMEDDMAIADLIECYRSEIDLESVPNSMVKYIDELEKLYDSNNKHFSFLYQDLFSGFTISYNADEPIFTASAIKAPAMIYLYEMASRGEIDLNEELIYTSNYYSGGTGVLKNRAVNTSYSVEELVQYTIYNSDNIAYRMLMDKLNRENLLNFWKELGTEYIFTLDTIWGVMSARDASIYMRELYNFSRMDSEYGSKLMEHFKKAQWKLVANKDGSYNTANKGGWSGTAIHDVAIVFDENPYILVIMSNLGEEEYFYLFDNTSKKIGKLHEEYWKYKVDVCGNIKLY